MFIPARYLVRFMVLFDLTGRGLVAALAGHPGARAGLRLPANHREEAPGGRGAEHLDRPGRQSGRAGAGAGEFCVKTWEPFPVRIATHSGLSSFNFVQLRSSSFNFVLLSSIIVLFSGHLYSVWSRGCGDLGRGGSIPGACRRPDAAGDLGSPELAGHL